MQLQIFELGMDGLHHPPLSISEANDILNLIERHPLILNEKWYVIGMDWWKTFISSIERGETTGVPPIDNASLCDRVSKQYVLKKNLIEKQDFILVPSAVFVVLRDMYGVVVEERDIIERNVSYSSSLLKSLRIEVYPATVRIARSDNITKEHVLEIFSTEPFDSVRKRALEVLDIDENSTVQCYLCEDGQYRRLNLTDLDTLLSQDDLVVVDVLGEDGVGLLGYLTNKSKTLFGKSSTVLRNGLTTATNAHLVQKSYRPGVCGLENLGNTCFMNSALQCLSNVREITEYFRSGRYEQDINEENVLGMHGQLARAYADLIGQLWSGTSRSVAPRKLKAVIGQYVQQFSGYSQHDSQELLSFLLDGLHEDLNRVKKKAYVEAKDSDGRPDHVVADEAWQMYKMGNDSIIVDYLHGQLKSTVVCPKCALVSVKFDPFCFLSVPLPPKEKLCKISVTLVPRSLNRKWVKYTVSVTRSTTVKELREMMQMQPMLDSGVILFGIISNKALVRVMDDDESLLDAHFPPMHQIFAYQLTGANEMATSQMNIVQVRNQLISTKDALTVPILMATSSTDSLNSDFIKESVLPRMKEYFARENIRGNGTTCTGNEDENINDVDAPIWQPALITYSDFSGASEQLSIPDDRQPLKWPSSLHKSNKAITITFLWPPNTIRDYRRENLQDKELVMRHSMRRAVAISECFDLFTRQELLSDDNLWYCPRCKEHQRATKKLDLWRLPPVLIVHLKRFHFTRWSREKIDLPVEFPLSGLDLTGRVVDTRCGKFVYDLIAVSNHAGGLGGGHYTAYARNGDDWYDFNDSTASAMGQPNDSIVSKEAYVLFYRRRFTDTEANMEIESED